MHPKFLMVLVFIWICGVMLGLILEANQPFASGTSQATVFTQLTAFQHVEVNSFFDSFKYFGAGLDFFKAIGSVLMMDFSFLKAYEPYGDYIKWIVLGPIIVLIVYGIFATLVGIISRNV